MSKQRDSGIELMRIIAMLMVVGLHALLYGDYLEAVSSYNGVIKDSAYLIRIIFAPCVNMFVIISGYFMVTSSFDLKKTCKRTFSVYKIIFFYSVVLSVLVLILGPQYYTVNGVTENPVNIIVRMFIPVSSSQWYFFTSYIFMCLLAPFLNIVLQKLTKRQYLFLILVIGFFLSICLTLACIKPLSDWIHISYHEALKEGKSVFWFLYIYTLGGYVRLHVKPQPKPRFRYLLIAAICAAIGFTLYITAQKSLTYGRVYIDYVNPLIIIFAVCMLLFFRDLHFHSKIVNTIASATIGVYAIHEFKFLREPIWSLFDLNHRDFSNIWKDLFMFAGMTLAVFFGCILCDIIRQQIFRFAGFCARKIKTVIAAKKQSSLH